MADVMNTYQGMTAEQAEFYHKTLLTRLEGELMITKYAQKGLGAPKNSGDKISYRKFNSLTCSKDALVEGVTPDALQASVSKIETVVEQHGDYLVITDKLNLLSLDPVVTELTEVLGTAAGEKMENITVETLAAGTNVVYAGGKTSRADLGKSDVLTAEILLRVATQLKAAKAKPIALPDGSKGYIMFASTKQAYDLKQDATWLAANTHVDNKGLINGLVGKLYGIYVVEYDFAPELAGAGAAGADVFQAIVLSEGSFGIPDINGSASPKMIIKTAEGDNSNTSDPLNQRSTIGYKNLFSVLILDQLRVVRVETSSSF